MENTSLAIHQPHHKYRCQHEQTSASKCLPQSRRGEKACISHIGISSIFHVLQSLDLLNIYNNVTIYQTSYQAVSEAPRARLLCVQSRDLPLAPFFLWRTFLVEAVGSGRQISLPSCTNASVGSPQALVEGTAGPEVHHPAGDQSMRTLRCREWGLPPGAPLPFRHPCHADLTFP